MRAAAFLLSLLLFACSSSPVPDDILPPDKMELVIHDLMQTDEYLNTLKPDSTLDEKKSRSIYYAETFRIHNTTRSDFYKSYEYYQQHPGLHKALFDTLSNRLTRSINDTVKQKTN